MIDEKEIRITYLGEHCVFMSKIMGVGDWRPFLKELKLDPLSLYGVLIPRRLSLDERKRAGDCLDVPIKFDLEAIKKALYKNLPFALSLRLEFYHQDREYLYLVFHDHRKGFPFPTKLALAYISYAFRVDIEGLNRMELGDTLLQYIACSPLNKLKRLLQRRGLIND